GRRSRPDVSAFPKNHPRSVTFDAKRRQGEYNAVKPKRAPRGAARDGAPRRRPRREDQQPRRLSIKSEVISSADFQSKVLDAKGPVLVDFFATWCGPCKMLAPTLDEVAQEVAGKAAVYKLDIDQSPDIAQRYGVMSVPTLIVFEDGQAQQQAVGVQPQRGSLAP